MAAFSVRERDTRLKLVVGLFAAAVALIVLVPVCCTFRNLNQIYAEVAFDPVATDNLVARLRTGALKAHLNGGLALPRDLASSSKNGCAYVTYQGQEMLVLLPSYGSMIRQTLSGICMTPSFPITFRPIAALSV